LLLLARKLQPGVGRHQYHAVNNLHCHRLKPVAQAGALHAKPALDAEQGAVGRAYDVRAIRRQELVRRPVERNCSTPLSTENASSINGIAFPMDKAAGVT